MANQDLIFYVELHVKPECVQEWKTAVTDVIERMSKEDAFVSCTLHQDLQDENRFTLYERWREPSVEAFIENQMKPKTYRHPYEERLPALLQTPRTASVTRFVQAWHGNN